MKKVQRIAVVGTMSTVLLGFRGELIKAMVAQGHQVFAFANDYTEETAAEVRLLGAEPVSYTLGRLSLNPFAELWSCWQLYAKMKTYRIEVSFCYFAKPVIYGTIAAWLAKVPLRVAKIEGLGRTFTLPPEGDRLKNKIIRHIQVAMYRFSLARTQHVFLLNPDDKIDLIDHYQISCGKITQLNGIGVALEQYVQTPVPIQPMRFIFVGRLLTEKGIHYFLAAAERIKARYPATEFVVLGEPDGRQGITRKQLMAYVAAGTVVYPGRVKNVLPYLQQSSVFVLPSYYREGVPRSTQEAIAVGRAVITTDSPGCRETVKHGVNGLLVPIHDVEALFNAMLKFVEDEKLAIQMGAESYRLAQEKFDAKKINQKIIQTLEL